VRGRLKATVGIKGNCRSWGIVDQQLQRVPITFFVLFQEKCAARWCAFQLENVVSSEAGSIKVRVQEKFLFGLCPAGEVTRRLKQRQVRLQRVIRARGRKSDGKQQQQGPTWTRRKYHRTLRPSWSQSSKIVAGPKIGAPLVTAGPKQMLTTRRCMEHGA